MKQKVLDSANKLTRSGAEDSRGWQTERQVLKQTLSIMKGLSLSVAHFTRGKNSLVSDVYTSFAGLCDLESAHGPDDGASKCDEGKPSHFLQT